MLLELLGWLMVLGGLAALVLPGPGLLLIFGGLLLLSQQYDWAERLLEPVQVRALQAAADSVATRTRVVASTTSALLLVVVGVFWMATPEVPGWWPLSDGLWLPGGIGTGISVVASGLIALGLVGYSYRRFVVRGEQPPTLAEIAEREQP